MVHTSCMNAIAISKDDQTIVSGGHDGTVMRWQSVEQNTV